MPIPEHPPKPICRRLTHTNYGYQTHGEFIDKLDKILSVMSVMLCFFSIPDHTPSAMSALHQFGAEMVKLSRGLESAVFEKNDEFRKIQNNVTPKIKR
jgi:hypothetical protein